MSSVIKSDRVRVEPGRPRPAGDDACTRSARIVQVDGLARAIEVRCSCGETTLLELTYPEDAKESGPAPEAVPPTNPATP